MERTRQVVATLRRHWKPRGSRTCCLAHGNKENSVPQTRTLGWFSILATTFLFAASAVGQVEKPTDGARALFDGTTLDGWKQLNGTATYEVQDGCIVGTTADNSPNSFLCTNKEYGDFELEFDVKIDSRLNSGVQIRSESKPEYNNGRGHGYQVEIATNANAGRIYDEARHGKFLDEGSKDPQAATAFRKDEWNRYRVVCRGDSIKTWINGIQIVDLKDDMTAKGFIGLQVHAFKGDTPAKVWWKNLRLTELSRQEPTTPMPMGGG